MCIAFNVLTIAAYKNWLQLLLNVLLLGPASCHYILE